MTDYDRIHQIVSRIAHIYDVPYCFRSAAFLDGLRNTYLAREYFIAQYCAPVMACDHGQVDGCEWPMAITHFSLDNQLACGVCGIAPTTILYTPHQYIHTNENGQLIEDRMRNCVDSMLHIWRGIGLTQLFAS